MSPAEIREQRLAYPLTQGELAARLGVSGQAVRNWEAGRRHPSPKYVRALGRLFRPRTVAANATRRHWSPDEEAMLRVLVEAGTPPAELAATLNARFDRSRSRWAVVHRAHDLGLSFRGDWYSEGEVRRLLGLRWHDLQRWRSAGALPAVRHASPRTGATSPWWRYEGADVRAFVDRYAGLLFDPRDVKDRALRARAEVAAIVNRRQAV